MRWGLDVSFLKEQADVIEPRSALRSRSTPGQGRNTAGISEDFVVYSDVYSRSSVV